MIQQVRFTPRQWLIVLHDLTVTAAAIVATFFIRFEDEQLRVHLEGLGNLLPAFVVYAGFVYFAFGLYKAKWRFASLPDLGNIFRASTVLAVSLLVLDYILLSPNFYGTFYFGKITIALYWVLQMAFLGGPRVAYRYFRYTRVRHQAMVARVRSDADPRPCGRRRSAAARDRERRGEENLAGRHPLAFGVGSGPVDPRHHGARRFRPARKHRRRSRRARHTGRAGRAHAVGVRAGCGAGSDPDAGAAARADDQPAAVARRRRRGAAARAGRGRGSAAAAEREDRLPAAGKFREGQVDRRHRRRRLDRRGNLRSRRSRSARRGCW